MRALIAISIFFILSTTPFVHAQITWTQKIKHDRGATINSEIIHTTKDGIYTLFQNGDQVNFSPNYELRFYSNELTLNKSLKFKLKLGKKRLEYVKTVGIADRLYVLAYYKGQKNIIVPLFAREIDTKTLTWKGEFRKIAEVKDEKFSIKDEYFYLAQSNDKTKLLVTSPIFEGTKRLEKTLHVQVFDKDLQLIWEQTQNTHVPKKLIVIPEYKVSNQGNVYIMARIYKKVRREKVQGQRNYEYKVLAFQNQGRDYKEHVIDLQDKYVQAISSEVHDDKNMLLCAGFYSDKGNGMKGTIYQAINFTNQEIKISKLAPIDPEFIKKAQRLKAVINFKAKEYKDGQLRELILRADGGVLLIAKDTAGTMVPGNRGPISIISVNPDGTVAWSTLYYLKQGGAFGRYGSYASMINGTQLHLFYNNSIGGLAFQTVQVIIDRNGEIIETIKKDTNMKMVVKNCEQISDNRMIFFADHQGGKLSFYLGQINVEKSE